MKLLRYSIAFLFFIMNLWAIGQSEDHEKLENLKYFNISIKDNVESMRYYTDSTNVLRILDQVTELTTQLDNEFDKVKLPEILDETQADIVEEEIIEENYDWMNETPASPQEDEEGLGVSNFIPFGKKIKTKVRIDFGINMFTDQNNTATITKPELNTGRSWFWEFGIYNQARLGSSKSKVAINYGISYLINRFTFSNDVRLTSDLVDRPLFTEITDVTKGPKLNIGYITVPLSFKIALAKKSSLELGGYAGYRVHTVQKFSLRRNNEDIKEYVYARHQLNNWIYGASLNLRIKGINLGVKYNLSNMFRDNSNYDFRTLMIGTSIKL